ncbi:hypothetical protein Dimus_021559 [Dionaea muscipula]
MLDYLSIITLFPQKYRNRKDAQVVVLEILHAWISQKNSSDPISSSMSLRMNRSSSFEVLRSDILLFRSPQICHAILALFIVAVGDFVFKAGDFAFILFYDFTFKASDLLLILLCVVALKVCDIAL